MTLKSYDPIGPLRDPRSRKTLRAATRDMAQVIRRLAGDRGDGADVADADLMRAGFTVGELDHCRADAMAIAAGRPAASRAETVLDMTAFLSLSRAESFDGTVTRDDLARGGFTSREIDECCAEAVSELAARRRPAKAAA